VKVAMLTISKSLEETAVGLRVKRPRNERPRKFEIGQTAIAELRFEQDRQQEYRRLYRLEYKGPGDRTHGSVEDCRNSCNPRKAGTCSAGGEMERLMPDSDTFNEKHWQLGDLGISKTTLKRLTLIELESGATDIGTVRIGPKKAHTLYVYTDSALRRIHNRIMGSHYDQRRAGSLC
jgi:hypothetical protein